MAEVVLSPASAKQVWRKQAIVEYVRMSRFLPYTGPGSSTASSMGSATSMPIIQVLSDLKVGAGNIVNVPFFGRLKGQGVSGNQVLVGAEDVLNNTDAAVKTDWIRNGIVVSKGVQFKTEIDLMNIGKMQLGTWMAEKLRDNLIQAMAAVIVPGLTQVDQSSGLPYLGADQAVPYAFANTAQLNTYLQNNIDRILMGNAVGNTSSGSWATSLANISTTTGRASTLTFSLAKRMAKLAGTLATSTAPHFRPYMTKPGKEYFVAFCATNTFRDVQADAAMTSANRDARPRDVDANPLFQDGDLIYNGVVYVEMPELNQLTQIGVGANGSNVDMNFMCGQQAIALAYSEMMDYVIDNRRDYQFRPGVAVQECRGQMKLSTNGTQLGVFPVLTSSVGDT